MIDLTRNYEALERRRIRQERIIWAVVCVLALSAAHAIDLAMTEYNAARLEVQND